MLSRKFISAFAFWLAAPILLATTITRADDVSAPVEDLPTVLVLEYAENGELIDMTVKSKLGLVIAPSKDKQLFRLRVLQGHALPGERQPADRIVELYQEIEEAKRVLLAAISVRYFRDARGLWVPHFQLNEEIYVKRDKNGRWRPLPMTSGAVPVVMFGSTLPNPEGFYPALEFGLTLGLMRLDSWIVR